MWADVYEEYTYCGVGICRYLFCLAYAVQGEVVRIRVPFSGEAGNSSSGTSRLTEGASQHRPHIERHAKEISPRYNGHKVTIQVPYLQFVEV